MREVVLLSPVISEPVPNECEGSRSLARRNPLPLLLSFRRSAARARSCCHFEGAQRLRNLEPTEKSWRPGERFLTPIGVRNDRKKGGVRKDDEKAVRNDGEKGG